jgi:hypothetical protein
VPMPVRKVCATGARLSTPPIVDAVGAGNCEGAAAPLMSVNAGCAAVGAPSVEIPVTNRCVAGVRLSTPPIVDASG